MRRLALKIPKTPEAETHGVWKPFTKYSRRGNIMSSSGAEETELRLYQMNDVR
jgi:hypothetical protein